jgi:hypothetical protein
VSTTHAHRKLIDAVQATLIGAVDKEGVTPIPVVR